jgi:hypothetical protein
MRRQEPVPAWRVVRRRVGSRPFLWGTRFRHQTGRWDASKSKALESPAMRFEL